MNKRRIRDLIKVLKKVKDKDFDQDFYCSDSLCETKGCQIGHYAAAFPNRKSELGTPDANNIDILSFIDRKSLPKGLDFSQLGDFWVAPFDGVTKDTPLPWISFNFEMIAKHFDISFDEANNLFSDSEVTGVRTRKDAIKKLEDFLKQ